MPTAKAKAAPPQLVLEFDFERDTKNAFRFQQADVPEGQRPEIGTLYITKAAISESGLAGKRLVVTIEDAG